MQKLRKLLKTVLLLTATSALALTYACAWDIDSHIPAGVPQYLDGDAGYELNWVMLGLHQELEIECVNLHIAGFCYDGTSIKIKWGFRLPVQFVENVPNVGESRFEDPLNYSDLYSDYEKWYQDAADYVGRAPISIAPNQRRRSGLRMQDDQNVTNSEAHLWSTDSDYSPLILSFLPSYCTTWDEYDPFKTDVYPNQALWRIPEYTSDALPGAYDISPMQCAAANVINGKMDPGLVNTGSISGLDYLVATKTCASSWGGKIWPLNGQSYAPDPAVGRALNSRKAIELAPYALSRELEGYVGSQSHSFNDSKDRFQAYYPSKSSCFAMGENPAHWATGLNSPGKENHHVYIHWQYHECCY